MSKDQFRFIGQNHYHDGRILSPGDVVELGERAAEAFSDKFEPAPDASTSVADTEATSDEGESERESLSGAKFADLHWQNQVSAIEAGKVDGHLGEIIENGSEKVSEAAEQRQSSLNGE